VIYIFRLNHCRTHLLLWKNTGFLVGFSISQLFYGPLSDYYGRKPILLIGFCLYILSTGLCMFSPSVRVLLILRFIQGIGIGAASVLSRAIMLQMLTSFLIYLLMVIKAKPVTVLNPVSSPLSEK
jgi:MFS transporter, DHA1 family, multidrug resistance protein